MVHITRKEQLAAVAALASELASEHEFYIARCLLNVAHDVSMEADRVEQPGRPTDYRNPFAA